MVSPCPREVNARIQVYNRIVDIMDEASDKKYDGNQFLFPAYVSF